MKRKILLLTALIYTIAISAQMPKWLTGGGGYLDFTGTSPQFTPSSIALGTGAYDELGNVLFTVTGGNINTSNAGSVTISEGEVSVIRVPGKCDQWYVIGVKQSIEYGSNPNANSDDRYRYKLQHAVIKMINGLPNLIGSVVNDGIIADLGYPGLTTNPNNNSMNTIQPPGIAVSKLNGNNERYLYTVGLNYLNNSSNVNYMKRFTINGVNPTSSFQSFTISNNHDPFYFGSAVRELELYESANGTKILAWGDSTDAPNNINSYNPARLYTAVIAPSGPGLDCTVTYYPLPQQGKVGGLEFYNNGQNIVFSISHFQDASGLIDYGLRTINLSTGAITSITNSLREGIPGQVDSYQTIEKDVFGNYFVVKTEHVYSGPNPGLTFKLMTIDLNNLLLNSTTYQGAYLPDQVDDEDYYAGMTTNLSSDLAAFDSDLDIGIEPNPSASLNPVYLSNDIWNRLTNDNGLNITPENPGYGGLNYNVMRFRVRNIGCAASLPSYAKLYWSIASTGQAWPESWTNNGIPINGSSQASGNELTTPYLGFNPSNQYVPGQGFAIPALAPGEEYIIDAKWQPVDPTVWGMNLLHNYSHICFLGRITDPNQPMFNENPGPYAPTTPNIINNNNIVTRNATLVQLNGVFTLGTGGFFIGNYFSSVRNFDVRFEQLQSSSVPFEAVGRITSKLDNRIWDRWKATGFKSEGIEVLDYNTHEILIRDPQKAILKDIPLESKEYLPVVFNFQLANTSINTVENYNFAVSQSLTENPDKQYGSVCHFLVSINEKVKDGEVFCDDGCNEENKKTGNASVFEENIKFSPNPVSDIANVDFTLKADAKITAKVVDYYGRPVKTIVTDSKLVKGTNKLKFSTSDLINGIYILTINTSSESRSLQFIVKH